MNALLPNNALADPHKNWICHFQSAQNVINDRERYAISVAVSMSCGYWTIYHRFLCGSA
jgi:hypothetical protein